MESEGGGGICSALFLVQGTVLTVKFYLPDLVFVGINIIGLKTFNTFFRNKDISCKMPVLCAILEQLNVG